MTNWKRSLRLNQQLNTSYTSPETSNTDTTSSPYNTSPVTDTTEQEGFRTKTQGQSQSTSSAKIDTSSQQLAVEYNTSQQLLVDSELAFHKDSYQNSNYDSRKDSDLQRNSDQDSHSNSHRGSHVNTPLDSQLNPQSDPNIHSQLVSHLNSHQDSHKNSQLDSHFETDNRTNSSVKTDVISPHVTEINVPKSSQFKNTQDESESSRSFLVTYSVEDGKSRGNLAEKEFTGYSEGMLMNRRNRRLKREFGRNGPFFKSKYFYKITYFLDSD